VARRTGSENGIGRATGALRVGPIGIEPEPQRDADGVRQGLEQRNGAVDTAAHSNGNATGRTRSPKHRPDRIRERINSECLPTNGSSLEQSQPNKRTLQARSISLDDALTVERKAHERKVSTPSRISNELQHRTQASANRRECRLCRRSPQRLSETGAIPGAKSSWPGEAGPDFATLTRPCRVLRPL